MKHYKCFIIADDMIFILRWQECGEAGIQCCENQITTPVRDPNTAGKYCQRTWDGYGCWTDTDPGQVVEIACPSFMPHAIRTGINI